MQERGLRERVLQSRSWRQCPDGNRVLLPPQPRCAVPHAARLCERWDDLPRSRDGTGTRPGKHRARHATASSLATAPP
ncbi:hypothetical protein SKAU_G00132680 [Synaphobranchus kaupii]|uniref:Uncharacterized protein n=1 Tax=Synaphobranchus kaupii TaxID=118154 RepID=A0A9Q1FRP7_SYNKA|nr:hypothetical protein SKAU_G00132680 [Synaphobranchus kaupii]